jgi:phenylacetate-coenzyme A ligase PaaK-like adenylate-forming protein
MTAKLRGDDCQLDWIWDRAVETASREETFAAAATAWDRQLEHLLEDSPFMARKLREAGVGPRGVGLADIAKLPFSTKEELKAAIDEAPPLGSNAGVPPERVKRIYQTSGTSRAPSVIALTATDVETWTSIGTRTYYATGIHDHHAVLSRCSRGCTSSVRATSGRSWSTNRRGRRWSSSLARWASWCTPT